MPGVYMGVRTVQDGQVPSPAERVGAVDWGALAEELDGVGGAVTPPLLTADEAGELAELYEDDGAFRSTVDMARHRFGEGQYRYLAHPLPTPVAALRHALYPRLLPAARDWWGRLGRPEAAVLGYAV